MFTREFFRFFRALAKNNNREWFQAHKADYQRAVVAPMCGFIESMGPRLRGISPHFVANPRPHNGSMFRIYRDLRFARDKSPYKLHAACQFRHALGRDAHTVGFYVHLSVEEVVIGAGIWLPPSEELQKIRETIVDNPNAWRDIKTSSAVKRYFGGISGDGLKRPPRGFDADHEHIDDLKRKSFLLMRHEKPEIMLREDFESEVEKTFRAAMPLMEYIGFAQDIEI